MRSVSDLLVALNDSDPRESEAARKALLERGSAIADELMEALPTLNPKQLIKVISILGLVEQEACMEAVLNMLSHQHPLVRLTAVQTLARWRHARVVAALLPLLGDEQVLIQIGVATTLSKLGDAQAVDALLALLQTTPEPTVRYSVIRALGELGDERAVAAIRRYSDDSNHHVRADVEAALRKLGAR